jgi:hypothetical protein
MAMARLRRNKWDGNTTTKTIFMNKAPAAKVVVNTTRVWQFGDKTRCQFGQELKFS